MNGYLGIDVSKGYADFILLNPSKEVLEDVFQLDDTREGHDKLRQLLMDLIKEHGITRIYCGLESTGGLENNWYGSLVQWMDDMALSVARLNPTGIKKNIQARLERNVTDALSSRYIAEYMIAHWDAINYEVQDVNYSSFRSLHRHIFLQKKQKTQLTNQLKSILYSTFPELMRYCKESIPTWVLKLIEQYPSSQKLSKAKETQLTKIQHIDQDKAQSLITSAKSTVAFHGNKATEYLVKSLAIQILEKQQYIDECKRVLEQNCRGLEVTLLTSVPGIAEYSAAAIMIEIENVHRFPTAKHLVSYFGLHPELKESGDGKAIPKMSKKGRSTMRAILFMCAKSAVMYDEHLKAIFQRHRSNGKGYNQSIGVIMQKLLRITWGILTNQQEYNATIDQQNQVINEKNTNQGADEKNQTERKRRFQNHDNSAPISKRQSRKRRVHAESQASCMKSSTGSSSHTQ